MKILFYIKLLLLLVGITTNGYAQSIDATRKKHFNTTNSVAIKGYDVVSYYLNSKPVKGNKNFAFTYGNVIYYFSSLQNFNLFKANPAKYEPQYGGWCAYAMGTTGERWEIDPKTYKMVNGKLYLFYNKSFNNTLNSWNKNESAFLKVADIKWKSQFK